jgi:hypothetical protein
MPYIAVVKLLLDTESEAEAWSEVSAILTGQMQSIVPTSCLLDWQYEVFGGPAEVKVEDGYTPDTDYFHFPEHPHSYASEK